MTSNPHIKTAHTLNHNRPALHVRLKDLHGVIGGCSPYKEWETALRAGAPFFEAPRDSEILELRDGGLAISPEDAIRLARFNASLGGAVATTIIAEHCSPAGTDQRQLTKAIRRYTLIEMPRWQRVDSRLLWAFLRDRESFGDWITKSIINRHLNTVDDFRFNDLTLSTRAAMRIVDGSTGVRATSLFTYFDTQIFIPQLECLHDWRMFLTGDDAPWQPFTFTPFPTNTPANRKPQEVAAQVPEALVEAEANIRPPR